MKVTQPLAVPNPESMGESRPVLNAYESADFQPLRLRCQQNGLLIELCQREAVIGRHSDADLRLPLPDVSRHHCQLKFVEGRWTIADLNSTNGVYVNGCRIQEFDLRVGDKFFVGCMTFEVLPPNHPGFEETHPGARGNVQTVCWRLKGPT